MDDTREMDYEGFFGWVLAGVATIIATLSGLVAKFYQKQIADYDVRIDAHKKMIDVLQKRADECDRDRTELRVRVAKLEVQLGIDEGK